MSKRSNNQPPSPSVCLLVLSRCRKCVKGHTFFSRITAAQPITTPQKPLIDMIGQKAWKRTLAKEGYIEDQLKANEGDSNTTWKTIQYLGYGNTNRNREPMVLKINGEMCHNQVEIANHINNFFVTGSLTSNLRNLNYPVYCILCIKHLN